jgi:hypothetical protein
MDTVHRNSHQQILAPARQFHSAFHELRLKARFERYLIARDLGVTYPTVRGWDRGSRPQLGHMRTLAFLQYGSARRNRTDLGEAVGDPCGPHCSSKKVLPDDDNATHLWIQLSCQKCGNKKKPHRKGVHRHSEVCRKCYEDEEVTLTCVGYPPPFLSAKARLERKARHTRISGFTVANISPVGYVGIALPFSRPLCR